MDLGHRFTLPHMSKAVHFGLMIKHSTLLAMGVHYDVKRSSLIPFSNKQHHASSVILSLPDSLQLTQWLPSKNKQLPLMTAYRIHSLLKNKQVIPRFKQQLSWNYSIDHRKTQIALTPKKNLRHQVKACQQLGIRLRAIETQAQGFTRLLLFKIDNPTTCLVCLFFSTSNTQLFSIQEGLLLAHYTCCNSDNPTNAAIKLLRRLTFMQPTHCLQTIWFCGDTLSVSLTTIKQLYQTSVIEKNLLKGVQEKEGALDLTPYERLCCAGHSLYQNDEAH